MTGSPWHACNPLDLHNLARDWFVAARRIELAKLAAELGISRATAYRWAGNTEQLIGAVVASLLEDTFRGLVRSSRAHGSELIIEVVEKTMRFAHQFAPLRQFLTRDPAIALKLVASRHGPVQRRTIDLIRDLLDAEQAAGRIDLTVSTEALAYAITRIVESFLYADLITGAKPDLDSAAKILRLLLRQDTASSSA